ncbi:hypothetical protein [Paraclostridium sordellii]|uniref:hypothetical protein n=1 Tax=Paraclostridium sordellii TaxID=1505 RepID=UPI0005DFD683|nr:hypothetical protein [Paeniclostridium sordellii]CEP44903.1 putative lipoprotein [[Clostridium] sordellii] [Paeniclostridium sordellii]
MFKKIKQLFICLLSISMIIIFSSSNSYASLLIGGDEFEIISEDMLQKDPSGSDRPYFSLVEVMTKLSGIKSDDKKENTFQYIISANNKKDIITFNKNTFQINVNGKLLKDKYYEKDNKIYAPYSIFEKMNTSTAIESGLMDKFIVNSSAPKYNDVSVYNLGKDKYVLPDNVYNILEEGNPSNYISYNNNGSITVPEGKKLPLVIFLHGSYQGDGLSTYFDVGFSSNMKSLAKEKFVSLGLNLTPIYYLDSSDSDNISLNNTQKDLFSKILKQHVKSLLNSGNNGGKSTYGFDMKDKIDFNNVILVGHSRGGQNLFLANKILKEMGLNIKGNISIAPANYWQDFNSYDDIPTGIILPQLDGDVITLDGRNIFDKIRLQKRSSDLQLLYLYSANHNNFNSTIFGEDNSFVDSKGNTLKEPMSIKEQQNFSSKYIVNFAKSCIEKGSLSGIMPSEDGTLYNQKVLMSFVKGKSKVLFDSTSDSNSKMISGSFKKIIASTDDKKNTVGNVRLPGISDNYPLISLEFKNTSDKVDFKLPEPNDFTKFDTISFEIMQDSTSPINKGKNQMLDITLTDKNGKFHTISTPKDTYSLQYQPGKMTSIALRDEHAKTMYSNITPLSTLMIPLSEFNNKVDLSKISAVEISPSKSTGQGSFMLQSMYLSSINNDSKTKSLNLNSVIIYVLAFAISFTILFILTKKIINHKTN